MARNDWSLEEIGLLIDNFTKQKDEIGKILLENGFDRTMEAIKTKKRHLRRTGEVAGSTDERIADDFEGDIEGEGAVTPVYTGEEDAGGECGVVTPGSGSGAGFFPSATRRDIYGKYKSMMEELIAESKAGTVTPADDSPVESDAESIVLLLSDLHIGKLTIGPDGETTYDTEIALHRIEQLTQSVKRVVSFAQKSTAIDEIVVTLCGDILDGDQIYRTHAYNLDDHVAGQLKAATKALWDLIVELSNIEGIEKVRVATVRGNHGRLGMDAHVDSNADNLLYDNLQFAASLYGSPKITVTTKYSAYHVVEVRGHRLLLTHEAPLTCDAPAARAKLMGWIDLYNVDCVLGGHWHHEQISTIADRYIFRNGSLPGSGDDLSHRMGVRSSPCQLLFGISKNRLPTFIYPVTI